jgi:hypothetical protein
MVFEDCTHYIPMEAPERIAELVARAHGLRVPETL